MASGRIRRVLTLLAVGAIVSLGFFFAASKRSSIVWGVLLAGLTFYGAAEPYRHLWKQRKFWLHAVWMIALGSLLASFLIHRHENGAVAVALPLMLVEGLVFWWAIGWLNEPSEPPEDQERSIR